MDEIVLGGKKKEFEAKRNTVFIYSSVLEMTFFIGVFGLVSSFIEDLIIPDHSHESFLSTLNIFLLGYGIILWLFSIFAVSKWLLINRKDSIKNQLKRAAIFILLLVLNLLLLFAAGNVVIHD